MKRFTLAALLLVGLGARSHAQQVPNGNLKNWTTTATGSDHAQNWLTTDDLLEAQLGTPFTTGTITKTIDRQSGAFAAKLKTIGRVPGYLVLGASAVPRLDGIVGGLPFAGRPTALQLHYKLSGANLANDQPVASAVLTRTTNGQRQVIAQASMQLPAAATYTLAIIPLQYYSALTPDSIHIVIASGSGQTLTNGTTLYVHNIALDAPLPTREVPPAASFALFPNPSPNGRFILEATQAPALFNAPLTVRDLTGRVVLAQPALANGTSCREIDLRGQPAGIYVLHLFTAQGLVMRRLHIQ